MWPYNREYSETKRPLDIFQAGVAGRPLPLDDWHSSTIECGIIDVVCAEAAGSLAASTLERPWAGITDSSVNMIGVKKQ
jgi:hypothetical protein